MLVYWLTNVKNNDTYISIHVTIKIQHKTKQTNNSETQISTTQTETSVLTAQPPHSLQNTGLTGLTNTYSESHVSIMIAQLMAQNEQIIHEIFNNSDSDSMYNVCKL